MISENLKKVLKKQKYGLVGGHSAVQICRWTKKSLLDEGFCYKEKFYGISSHRCCQMSPSVVWCQNKCLHCWRAIEFTLGDKMEGRIDKPEKIIEECIKAQRKMLSGFKGNKKINIKKFKEAQNPSQFAISLSGEPTIYPYLAELIKELRKRGKSSFLVTNGLLPEKLLELKRKKALPTQLYLSLNAPNEKMYKDWHKSKLKDAWKRFNKTLSILPKLSTRRVIRMTLVRELNMKPEFIPEYAKLIKKSGADFVEVKGFMSVGFARKRLGYERMPSHEEIKDFAKRLLKNLKGYKFLDEKIESRVVLLGRNKKRMKIKKSEI
ncbi:MAG: 4-demethylwyosine synthase TYW1 [Nanoarchaeota archaeon]